MKQKYRLLAIGIALGIAYGLLTRITFGAAATLASLTYLFVIPTILGIVPFIFTDDKKLISYRSLIFIPWLTVIAFFLTLLMMGLEDAVCVLLLAAPFLALGTLGAFLFRLFMINKENRKGKLLSVLLIPFLLSPLEAYIKSPSVLIRVESAVVIAASPNTVWDQIVEVRAIGEEEYNAGFFHAMGIPRPISATVTERAVGGQRTGHFEGGLKFVETITKYEPYQAVSFDIVVDPQSVRAKAFDQHVLNGNYFTFVDAAYTLQEMEPGKVKLTLASTYQLTSTVNFYGQFWGNLMLKDFQDRLLEVIANRCAGA